MVGLCMDVTREKRAEESLRLLVAAGEHLGSSLDFEETFRELAQAIVPRFADWCVINTLRRDLKVRRVAIVHRDAELQESVSDLTVASLNDSATIRSLAKGESVLIERMSQRAVREYFGNTPGGDRIVSLGWGSTIITPLMARARTLGAITFVRQPRSPRYDSADLDVANQLARRAALSLDNSRLYSESERVREELAAANQVKDEFLDMVSHEMRTPLTFLQAGTSLLARRRGELDEREMSALIGDLESQGVQLQTMVENLLALARTGGAESLELEPCRLDRLVEGVLGPIKARNPQRAFWVDVGQLPLVSAHGASMERLVRNLISNAIKYSPPGEPIEIEANVVPDGRVALRVRDHGPGVPPEEMERIFERFYRSPQTATRSPGSGIGLALCRRLARMMGGDVVAENCEGGGLEVSVVLRAY
ncbi:MAG: GAF domain-containing sensor histidine kinase, partial [Gemmatimonadales bacterium]